MSEKPGGSDALPETTYEEIERLYAQLQEAIAAEGRRTIIDINDGRVTVTPSGTKWVQGPLRTEKSVGRGEHYRTSGEITLTNHDGDIVFELKEYGLTFPYKGDRFPGSKEGTYPIVAQVLKEALQTRTSPGALETGLRGVRGKLDAVLDSMPPRERGEKRWGHH